MEGQLLVGKEEEELANSVFGTLLEQYLQAVAFSVNLCQLQGVTWFNTTEIVQ